MSVNTIITYTGKEVDPFNMHAEDISIVDIAHSLSHACRYQGHTKTFYSVAEHSVKLSQRFKDNNLALWALLHDASEAYVGDIPKPIKHLFPGIEEAEARIMDLVASRFSLIGHDIPEGVKRADLTMVAYEGRHLMGKYESHDARWESCHVVIGDGDGDDWDQLVVEGWRPEQAKREFLERINYLIEEREFSHD